MCSFISTTRYENGEIASWPAVTSRALDHVVKDEEGKGCTPHLPFEKYKLEETVPVPAKKGDIVVFNIFTIHGSHINVTDRARRLVRIGFKHPDNVQTEGQSKGRPSWMVWGKRERREGQVQFRMD